MLSNQPTGRTRVFLDASVLIAAAISARGSARELIVAGLRGHLDLTLGQLTIAETERNLARKLPNALPVFTLLTQVLPVPVSMPPQELVDAVAGIIVSKDALVVAGALHAQAQFLVTYDRRHLLSQAELIEQRFGLVITTPDDVLRMKEQR